MQIAMLLFQFTTFFFVYTILSEEYGIASEDHSVYQSMFSTMAIVLIVLSQFGSYCPLRKATRGAPCGKLLELMENQEHPARDWAG